MTRRSIKEGFGGCRARWGYDKGILLLFESGSSRRNAGNESTRAIIEIRSHRKNEKKERVKNVTRAHKRRGGVARFGVRGGTKSVCVGEMTGEGITGRKEGRKRSSRKSYEELGH